MERPIVEYIKNGIWNSDIDEEWKRFLKSDRKVIIYGAGRQARVVLDFCHMFDKEVELLLATNSRDRWALLPREDELPLYILSEFPNSLNKSDYDVVLALSPKFNEEVKILLQREHFESIYAIEDWNAENDKIREQYFRLYFAYHGAEFHKDSEGEEYLINQIREWELRMYWYLWVIRVQCSLPSAEKFTTASRQRAR